MCDEKLKISKFENGSMMAFRPQRKYFRQMLGVEWDGDLKRC